MKPSQSMKPFAEFFAGLAMAIAHSNCEPGSEAARIAYEQAQHAIDTFLCDLDKLDE